jgi:HK97 family phage major capsid protein
VAPNLKLREQHIKDQARELDRRVKELWQREQPRGTEDAEIAALEREGKRLVEQAARVKGDREAMAKISELGAGLGLDDDEWGGGHSGGSYGAGKYQPPRVKALGGSTWGATLVGKQQQAGGAKALTPSGTIAVTVPLAGEVVREGTPVLALRQLLPAVENTTGHFAYMHQTLRDSQAATVAVGAVKPTSPFEASRVDDRVRTVAHLSEGVSRQDIADAPMLEEFLDAELRLGLETALENEIINGDGSTTGGLDRFVGLANTSGVQTQAWDTNELVTTRRAITKLEVLSLPAGAFVVSPTDWERIELLADNEASYYLGGPVNRAARRLWGTPVAVSTSLAANTAYLVDFAGSTELHLRQDPIVDWSENLYDPDALGAGVGASDWARNLIRWRAELRAGFVVKRPAGVVRIDLTQPV